MSSNDGLSLDNRPDPWSSDRRECTAVYLLCLPSIGLPVTSILQAHGREKKITAVRKSHHGPKAGSCVRRKPNLSEASVRLGHKSLRTLMKRSSSWYLPGGYQGPLHPSSSQSLRPNGSWFPSGHGGYLSFSLQNLPSSLHHLLHITSPLSVFVTLASLRKGFALR